MILLWDEKGAKFTINFTSPTQSIKYDFTVYVRFISNFAVLEYGGCDTFNKFFYYTFIHKKAFFFIFFSTFL